jgi:hypothetical protein
MKEKKKNDEKQNQLQPVLPNFILLLPGFSSPSPRILMIFVGFSKDFSIIEEAFINNVGCVEEFVIRKIESLSIKSVIVWRV